MSRKLDAMAFLQASASLGHLDQYRALVLNADYRPFSYIPLSTLSWKDAIVGIFQDKFDVVEEYEGIEVRSPSMAFTLPSVIANKVYRNPEMTVPFSKRNIYLRDNYTCQYCGNVFAIVDLTFDHLIPRSKGGGTTWENIVSSCETCNRKKANKLDWISPLGIKGPMNKPYRPNYFQLADNMKKRSLIIPEGSGWENWIDWQGKLYMKTKHGTHQLLGAEEEIGDEQIGM